MIMSALKHGVVSLIKSVNGNHVVQRCLQYLLPHCEKVTQLFFTVFFKIKFELLRECDLSFFFYFFSFFLK